MCETISVKFITSIIHFISRSKPSTFHFYMIPLLYSTQKGVLVNTRGSSQTGVAPCADLEKPTDVKIMGRDITEKTVILDSIHVIDPAKALHSWNKKEQYIDNVFKLYEVCYSLKLI